MLNKDEVQKLFNKERILVGNIDVIPKYAAKKYSEVRHVILPAD